MENQNYYEILGVSSKASLEDITAAKNALAKKYHPDANLKDGIDTTEQMQAILEAYNVLSDPVKRADYDRQTAGRKTEPLAVFGFHNDRKRNAISMIERHFPSVAIAKMLEYDGLNIESFLFVSVRRAA